MRIQTEIEIDAPAEEVFSILMDFDKYPEWNPLTVRIDGVAEVDEVLKLHVLLGGKKMVRKHIVSRVDPPEALLPLELGRQHNVGLTSSLLFPVDYMQGQYNVLWALHPSLQTDDAYHRGADISLLSQFESEAEVCACSA